MDCCLPYVCNGAEAPNKHGNARPLFRSPLVNLWLIQHKIQKSRTCLALSSQSDLNQTMAITQLQSVSRTVTTRRSGTANAYSAEPLSSSILWPGPTAGLTSTSPPNQQGSSNRPLISARQLHKNQASKLAGGNNQPQSNNIYLRFCRDAQGVEASLQKPH